MTSIRPPLLASAEGPTRSSSSIGASPAAPVPPWSTGAHGARRTFAVDVPRPASMLWPAVAHSWVPPLAALWALVSSCHPTSSTSANANQPTAPPSVTQAASAAPTPPANARDEEASADVPLPSPGEPLRPEGLWVTGEDALFVFGSEGEIARSNDGGRTFVRRSTGVAATVVGMGRTLRSVHAVCDQGIVLCSADDGVTWTVAWRGKTDPMSADWTDRLSAIWADAKSDAAFAVGKGAILRTKDGGARWEKQTNVTKALLNAVWGTSADDVYAVGDDGAIFHTRDGGARWDKLRSGTRSQLFAIWGSGPEDVYIAANDDLILRSTDRGATWKKQKTGRGMHTAVWGSGPHDVFVGTAWRGAGGAVLRTTNSRDFAPVLDGITDVVALGGAGKRAVYVLLTDGKLLRSAGGAAPFSVLEPAFTQPK